MNLTNTHLDTPPKKALVLGATGGIGSEVARQLISLGWQVNGLARKLNKDQYIKESKKITWIQGDALNETDIELAAQGCSVIIHAVNPPGYKNWAGLVLPMLQNTISVAKKLNAAIVLPGTIYNYGPDSFPLISESSPQKPLTRKGTIRVKMEQDLERFAHSGGQVIIVRAGDFFGPSAVNSWFSQGLIKPNKPINIIHNPASLNIGHQWSYLPDVAKTMVTLIEKRGCLDPFSTFHTKGFWDDDGQQMTNAICRVVQKNTGKKPRVRPTPWWIMRLISPFQETLRELIEMQYLWQEPVQMNNEKLLTFMTDEPTTPIDIAIENTLKALKCI